MKVQCVEFYLLTAGLMLTQVSLPTVTSQTTQDHYYNLINHLFNDYKTEVRPTMDNSFTTVWIHFWLLSIQNLDEKNQILSTAVILQTTWSDPWLTWDPNTYGNVSVFRYPQKKLWLPDVVVINSVESQAQLGYDQNPILVNSDGNIVWYPSEILHTSCDMDVTYYPFDTQICEIIISTWVSTSTQIDLDLEPNTTDLVMTRYSPSGTWELTDTHVEALANDGDFTRLKYSLKLKRLSVFYVMNMIIPVLFLSLTASAVFYLPSEAGEKIGMSMTVLLSYAVYLTIISDNMPQTSLQISILSVYLTMLLGITACSVVLSVLILHWHHTPEDEKVGRKVTAVTRKLRQVFRLQPKPPKDDSDQCSGFDLLARKQEMSSSITSATLRSKGGKVSPAIISDGKIKVKVAKNPIEPEPEEEKITWPVVGDTADLVIFVSISSFIIFLTILILLILIIGGAAQNAATF